MQKLEQYQNMLFIQMVFRLNTPSISLTIQDIFLININAFFDVCY
jgi:hypothetical protein